MAGGSASHAELRVCPRRMLQRAGCGLQIAHPVPESPAHLLLPPPGRREWTAEPAGLGKRPSAQAQLLPLPWAALRQALNPLRPVSSTWVWSRHSWQAVLNRGLVLAKGDIPSPTGCSSLCLPSVSGQPTFLARHGAGSGINMKAEEHFALSLPLVVLGRGARGRPGAGKSATHVELQQGSVRVAAPGPPPQVLVSRVEQHQGRGQHRGGCGGGPCGGREGLQPPANPTGLTRPSLAAWGRAAHVPREGHGRAQRSPAQSCPNVKLSTCFAQAQDSSKAFCLSGRPPPSTTTAERVADQATNGCAERALQNRG